MTRAPLRTRQEVPRTRQEIATAHLLTEIAECLTTLLGEIYELQPPETQQQLDTIDWRLADALKNYRDVVREL